MEDAQQQIDAFRWDYNEHHPYRALGALSRRECVQRAMTTAADPPSQWTEKPGLSKPDPYIGARARKDYQLTADRREGQEHIRAQLRGLHAQVVEETHS